MSAPVDHVGLQARLQPEGLAAVELASGRKWTYAGLDAVLAKAAGALAARGIGLGDRVAALSRNRVSLLVLHLACARLGAIYVPLNWRLQAVEIAALIEDAEPALLLGDGELALAGIEGLSLEAFEVEIEAATPLATPTIDKDRPSLILYTSGTSGRPKGVLLSERNLDQTAINFGRLGRVAHDSVFLVDAPMFHVIGLVTSLRPTFLHGGTVLISDGFVPARTQARIGDGRLAVSHYFCVPQMAAQLRCQPGFDPALYRGLTAIFTGGAPHAACDIRAWLADGVPVADGFGMSEAGTVFGMPVDPALIDARAGSAGVAMPGVSARIVDDEGGDCPDGVAGELLLKGDNLFSGYWRRARETEAAFTGDGWFRTGDIARADAEGFHWLVDRKKDMFISGGENVYPAEIEMVAAAHPAVAECAVVGLPDPRWGEVGHLAVVVRPETEFRREQLLAWLEPRLARYKLPKAVIVLDRLPRTGSGKVQKAELRAWLLEGADVAGRAAS